MMLRIKIVSLCFAFAVVCGACNNEHPVFEQTVAIGGGEWSKDSTVAINIPVSNTEQLYELQIYVRNRADYPYSNLYLFVTAITPSGGSVTDTVQYPLADKYGNWLGKGFSKLWDNRFPFRGKVKFNIAGDYQIQIRQGMRDEPLIGITDVGVRLMEAK